MTPQEQQMIDGLISRIRSTDVQNKDTQAEQHIQQGLTGSPDALYVLVQTVLVQQYGLEQAQSQLRELKQQVQTLQSQAQQAPKSSSGGFLSHIFGGDSQPAQPVQTQGYQPVNNPGSQSYPAPPPPPYPGQSYPAQAYPGQSYPGQAYPPQGGGMFGGGGGGLFGRGGGFLQGAMQTAAGVAAGELAFQGMEDLFHGFGGHERGFSGSGGSGETIVNDYYDQDRGSDRDFGDRGRDDSSFYNPGDDASRDNSGSDLSASDNFADNSSDDLSFDDNTSDDGGLGMGGDDFSSDNS